MTELDNALSHLNVIKNTQAKLCNEMLDYLNQENDPDPCFVERCAQEDWLERGKILKIEENNLNEEISELLKGRGGETKNFWLLHISDPERDHYQLYNSMDQGTRRLEQVVEEMWDTEEDGPIPSDMEDAVEKFFAEYVDSWSYQLIEVATP